MTVEERAERIGRVAEAMLDAVKGENDASIVFSALGGVMAALNAASASDIAEQHRNLYLIKTVYDMAMSDINNV